MGSLVPPALAGLDRGGTLAIAGIHLSDIPSLNYAEHLFEERTLRSVTANTRADGVAFLDLADRIGIETTTRGYRFDEVDIAARRSRPRQVQRCGRNPPRQVGDSCVLALPSDSGIAPPDPPCWRQRKNLSDG